MIQDFSFGRIVVNGETYSGDIKIVEGRIIPSWWRQRGHSVALEDVQDILGSHPDVLVIGKGEPGLMRTSQELKKFLKTNGIELIEEKTRKAINSFNRLLRENKKVAAGFHVGC